jgi:uncharacterized membrane protein YkoI
MMKSALTLAAMILACLSTRPSPERLLKEAKITLPEAIGVVLPELKDGTPVTAYLREENSRVLYVVTAAQGEGGVRMSIDAKTQEIVARTTLKKSYAKRIGASKVSMAKAIEIATARVAGKATGVEFELKKGKAVVEVKVFLDGKLYEVKIDAVTGSVLKVEQDDDEDDDGKDNDGDEDDDD